MMSRHHSPVVRVLSFAAAGVVTFSLLAALEFGSMQQHRQALWAFVPPIDSVQQIEIVGRRLPPG